MPKLAKVGTFRKTAAAAAAAPKEGGGEELSRGQRKRLQKREQYLQKEKMILSTLKLKRQEEQKNQIDGMDAIRSALLDTVVPTDDDDKGDETPTITAPLIKSNKSKQSLVQKEVTHLNLVRQHPAFQADPFATIREHLQNTLAQTAPQRQKETARQLKERNDKKEQKKALKKENASYKKKRPKKFKATRSKSRS